MDNYQWNQELICLSSLIRSCKIKNDCFKTRLPVTKNLFDCSLFEVEKHFLIENDDPYGSTLFKTMFMFAYYGLMRIGKITESLHVVKAKDVHLSKNNDKILIILHTSKTHGISDPAQQIKISDDLWKRNNAFFFKPMSEIREYFEYPKAMERMYRTLLHI